jgi:hypothetical protein
VASELSEKQGVFFYFVDDAMLIGDSPGPVARKAVLERFGLSYSLEW